MLAYASSQKSVYRSLHLDNASASSTNIVYASNKQIYQDVSVVKFIGGNKFSVYLANSRVTKLNYAMKVFPYENGCSHLYYTNESRFASLKHPNIVRYLYFENERKVKLGSTPATISYAMMEYAPHGNFLDFLKTHNKHIDEKLTRTYFKQLISGLEYLHKNGISHMDLKLDNLLLDPSFNLKIADFDMAYFQEDAIIISNGTKYFRAPEVISGKINNTKPADIYSAGIILFLLKTRGIFPQYENDLVDGISFSELLKKDPVRFWAYHSKMQKDLSFDQDFKDLFIAMTKFNPTERASFEVIRTSKWYNGPCYTAEELKEVVGRLF